MYYTFILIKKKQRKCPKKGVIFFEKHLETKLKNNQFPIIVMRLNKTWFEFRMVKQLIPQN